MAQLIKDLIMDLLIGDWDYVYAENVADLLVLVFAILIFMFIVKLFKWIVYAFRSVGKGGFWQ